MREQVAIERLLASVQSNRRTRALLSKQDHFDVYSGHAQVKYLRQARPHESSQGTKNIKRRVHVLPIEIELSSMAPRHDTAAPWRFEQNTAGPKNDDNSFIVRRT